MKIKVCLHNHTDKSRFSINTFEDFEKAFADKKVDKVAITDHDFFNSAKEFQQKAGIEKIILGQEITTTQGDIIGLFLKKFIPSGLSAERTCQLIKAQGGVVYIPHPFARKKGLGLVVLEEIKNYIDVVEIFNAWQHRTLMRPFTSSNVNKKAKIWAQKNKIPGISASDSHFSSNIGTSYVILENFTTADEFLSSLKKGIETVEHKNKINLLALRAFVKGFFKKDILKFIK